MPDPKVGKDLVQDVRLGWPRYSEREERTCRRGWRGTQDWALLSSKAMLKSLKLTLGTVGKQ